VRTIQDTHKRRVVCEGIPKPSIEEGGGSKLNSSGHNQLHLVLHYAGQTLMQGRKLPENVYM
jgi:hypothetical protein